MTRVRYWIFFFAGCGRIGFATDAFDPIRTDALFADAPGYRDVVLADEPLAYWRLEEPQGAVAADSSGNQLDGLYMGTRLAVTGIAGGASELDGTGSSFIDFGSAGAFDPASGSFTVEIWLRFPATDWVDYVDLFAKRMVASTASYWTVHAFPNNRLVFEFRDATGSNAGDVTFGTVNDTLWHHIVAVVDRDAGAITAYLDGVAKDTASIAGWGPVVVPAAARASSDALGAPFALDEISLYRTPLREERVRAHYVFVNP